MLIQFTFFPPSTESYQNWNIIVCGLVENKSPIMNIFEAIRVNLSVLGIRSRHSGKKYSKNAKSLIILFLLSVTVMFVFMHFEANNFGEQTRAFGTALSWSAICIQKAEQLFKVMRNFESAIQRSNQFSIII